jgi:hypothetical protein
MIIGVNLYTTHDGTGITGTIPVPFHPCKVVAVVVCVCFRISYIYTVALPE